MKQEKKQAGITVFFSYTHADQVVRDQLAIHLSQLKRDGLIEEWSDQQILAGFDRSKAIDQMLHTADIILLLISAEFLASDIHYEGEMQHALERHRAGVARVIPIIVRPCDWQHSPFAHLQCLPRNRKPIVTWRNRDEAFLAIAQELRLLITQQQFPPASLSRVPRENRERMLKRVRDIWIKGLLEESLHRAAWIDLNLQEQPDALENPWRFQVQELDRIPHALPDGTSIVEVYDKANGELLILGEPGSGKTTLLLKLAQDLLSRAEQDINHPLPVIFHLSSWSEKQASFAHWLAEELHRKYRVPHFIARTWIETDTILPLLDGLDEVASHMQVACVKALNTYRCDHMGPLALCSRRVDYLSLPEHLHLQTAVVIQPLTAQQIDDYLVSAGGQLAAVQIALQKDQMLQELVVTPLMLSILALTYQNRPVEAFLPTDSLDVRRRQIFATYTKRMLERRGAQTQYTRQQIMQWLAWLARQMVRQNQTQFYIERMQADWLTELQPERIFYKSISTLLGKLADGLFFGVVFGLAGMLLAQLIFGPLGAPLYGLLAGLVVGQTLALCFTFGLASDEEIKPTEIISWSWDGVWSDLGCGVQCGAACGLVTGLLSGLVIGLIRGVNAGLESALSVILATVFIIALLYWLMRRLSSDMLYERNILVSNQGIKSSTQKSILLGLVVAAVIGPIVEVVSNHIIPLVVGIPIVLVGTLIVGSILGEISSVIITFPSSFGQDAYEAMQYETKKFLFEKQERVNRRPRHPWRKSMFIISASVLVGVLGIEVASGHVIALIFGLSLGLIFGLEYGGAACIRHGILRISLWHAKYIPLNYSQFLDYATERILLHKVGGSYIFVHRLLLDYFAALDESMPSGSTFLEKKREK